MRSGDSKPRVVALVLAAGRGWRMGGPKALMMVGGRPWWKLQQEQLERAGVEALWVVSREVFARMGPPTPEGVGFGVRSVIADSDAPMFDSVRSGMMALQAEPVDGVFVLPVDVPVARREVWETLARSTHPAAAARGGLHGHPVYLPWTWAEANVLDAPRGARLDELLRGAVEYVEVEDDAVVTNLNTAEELRAWVEARGEG